MTTCRRGELKKVLRAFDVQATTQPDPLSEINLKNEIDAKRPVAVNFNWHDLGPQTEIARHLIVVRGWMRRSRGLVFIVNDPFDYESNEGPETAGEYSYTDYTGLRTAYGMGEWERTWIGLRG